jgi:hypothetical protein
MRDKLIDDTTSPHFALSLAAHRMELETTNVRVELA